MQGKKILTVPLIVITIAVWGYIIFRVVAYFTQPEEDSSVLINSEASADLGSIQKETSSQEEFIYEELDRDPFKLTEYKKEPPPQPKIGFIEKPFLSEPEFYYKINGIVMNGSGGLVILEDITNNSTHFLREGEQYKTLQIKRISNNKVILSEKSVEKEIDVYSLLK
ncbi:MAG TPA: hypothetical protein VHO28_01445 [Ignavibacteriales bacterium]|nr:hypothetical protein [Ignavibacteriales bacterium]